ncbi:MAG: hypothetical protein K2X81_16115, partial [Candidatus Obscuribacterales bacterium]|nr:hypothetical protein [Candidatus Obscuribacterales bacterium]
GISGAKPSGGFDRGGQGFSGGQGFQNRGGQGFENRGGQGFDNRGGQGFDNRGGQGFENRGGQGFENRGGQGFGNHPDQPISSHPAFPTDGGFGGISGLQNKTPHNINANQLHDQGNNIRNSFNGNQINHNNEFNRNNVNNVNVNHYGANGAYGHYGGYGGYGHYGYGGYGYHGWGYPGAWGCPGWSEASMWTCMGMSTLTSFLGLGMMGMAMSNSGGKNNNSTPASTTNVIYEGDNVYVNGQPAGTSTQYYQQAQQLASQAWQNQPPPVAPAVGNAAPASQADQWQALGVFSLAEPGQTQSNMMLQLAINKDGIVRGNYMNQLTNEKSQVYGSLDKATQRISWTIGQGNSTVFDSSLGDLVKDDSQVLVHYGPNNTQEMALIRLPAPPDAGGNGGAPSGNASTPAPGA